MKKANRKDRKCGGKALLRPWGMVSAGCLLCVCLFAWMAPLTGSAASLSEMNRNGYVTDGERGDLPGVIGDERSLPSKQAARTPAGAYGQNGRSGGGSGMTGTDIPGAGAAEDFADGVAGGIGENFPGNSRSGGQTAGSNLSAETMRGGENMSGEAAMRTFFGLVIAIVAAAVVLALVFLLMPKKRGDRW